MKRIVNWYKELTFGKKMFLLILMLMFAPAVVPTLICAYVIMSIFKWLFPMKKSDDSSEELSSKED